MTTDTIGGVWSYALELAAALGDDEVVLATMGPRPSHAQRAAAAELPNLSLTSGAWRLEWMQGAWPDVERAGDWLLDIADRTAPDLVHLNGYVHASLPWPAPVLVAAHSCVLSWWQAVRGERAPREWTRYGEAVLEGLQAADCVVAPTAAFLETLQRLYGPLPAARVIPNGRRASRCAPAPKAPFVFSAGRLWDEAKNMAVLDAAAHDLPWPVIVAGDSCTPDGGDVLYERLTRLGVLAPPELARRLQRASIYASPALYEPFGLAALEAGQAGCALVLGDIPTLREVWADAAVYVPPRDPEALRAALARLIGDPALRARYADRALRRARRCTPARMAAEYRATYCAMLAAAARRAAPADAHRTARIAEAQA